MLDRVLDVLFNFTYCSVVNDRTVCNSLVVPYTNFEALDLLRECLCEIVVDVFLYVYSIRTHTCLARGAEFRRYGPGHCIVQISIIEDYER